MGGRGTASGLASTPTASAAAPAPAPAPAPAAQPAPQPAPAPTRTSGLVSDTGVQNMTDAQLTALITRAMSASITHDGRQDTPAQRIADALGLTNNVPESVSQEALAQYRNGTYENGTIYRTVNDAGGKTGRQIAHELTSANDYGLNFGGGRAYGTGLYFAGTGPRGGNGAGAYESSLYGSSWRGAYTMEAHIKPTAKIATAASLRSASAKQWAKNHTRALSQIGLRVDASGNVHGNRSMSSDDVNTTVAMLMGYDGFRNGNTNTPYYTIFNRGALQVARGDKYSRASSRTL